MIALYIALPALIGAGLAIAIRARLARLRMLTWMGAALIGTGLPLLASQLVSLALSGTADARMTECQLAGGADCGQATMIMVLPLVAGLSAGLGWLAGAVTALLSRP